MISPLKFPFNLLEIFDGKRPAGITPSRPFLSFCLRSRAAHGFYARLPESFPFAAAYFTV